MARRKGGAGGRREGRETRTPRRDYADFLFRPADAFPFVDSGSGLGTKSGSLAILFSSDSSFRMVGTMAHLWGCPSARFLRQYVPRMSFHMIDATAAM